MTYTDPARVIARQLLAEAVDEPTVHPDQAIADDMAAGFRALANMFQAHPEVAAISRYSFDEILTFPRNSDELRAYVRAAKKHGATITKDVGSTYFYARLAWGPVGIKASAAREEVCERVVTGVETVTKTVPDPAALAAVPQVEVTEQVETVEWICRPLLADAPGVTS